MAVCDKTFRLLQKEPYADSFISVEPREEIPLESAGTFDCRRSTRRHPRESKGQSYDTTTEVNGSDCDPNTGRVTANTEYRINDQSVTLKEFKDRIFTVRNRSDEVVIVLHHLESDTVEKIIIKL